VNKYWAVQKENGRLKMVIGARLPRKTKKLVSYILSLDKTPKSKYLVVSPYFYELLNRFDTGDTK